MNRSSLRIRLLRLITLPLVLGLMMIGIGTYLSAKSAAEEIYDGQLAHFSRLLALLARHEIENGMPAEKHIRIKVEDEAGEGSYAKDFAYRVWFGGKLILQSENAVNFAKLPQEPGFSDQYLDKHLWRIFVLETGNIRVEAAEEYHLQREALYHVGLSILVPLFLIIPLLLLAVWVGVRLGIAPLRHISRLIQLQKPDNLQPVSSAKAPVEVLPLVDAINRMIERVDGALEREKRFTQYAAHELRTPLAALKTQIQVAMREKNEQTRHALISETTQIVDRIIHLLEQLLLFARTQQRIGMQTVCISDVALAVSESFLTLAASRRQQIVTEIAPAVSVEGNAELLSTLLRNLLDNASRYSPEGARIHVSLIQAGIHFILSISNDGVLLPAAEMGRLFDPFYRPSLANHPQGSGLGLAIVGSIARTHHFNISHSLEGQIFTVALEWDAGNIPEAA